MPKVEDREMGKELSVPFVAYVCHKGGDTITVCHYVVHLQKEKGFPRRVILFQENAPLWQVKAILNLSFLGDEFGKLFLVIDLHVLEIDDKFIEIGVELCFGDFLPVILSEVTDNP